MVFLWNLNKECILLQFSSPKCTSYLTSEQTETPAREEKDNILLFHTLPLESVVTYNWLSLCACPRHQPVQEPTVIWFIEIMWQGTEPCRSRFDVFPMIWAWVYSFPLWNRHPYSTCIGPRTSNGASQLNYNIRTVFTRLGLHFLSGGTGTLKRIQMWTGNHTEWRLPLLLTINVTGRDWDQLQGKGGLYQDPWHEKEKTTEEEV